MTALTGNRYTKYRDGLITAHPVAAGVHIYKGSLVCSNETGFAEPGRGNGGVYDQRFLGVALDEADNSLGADGGLRIRAQTQGVFSFHRGGSISQADVRLACFIVDDQTVTVVDHHDDGRGGSLEPLCGTIEGLDGTDVWVRIAV